MITINYNDVINMDISFLEKYYLKEGHVTGSGLLDIGNNGVNIIK
jgi:hypothetical protein